MLHQGIFNGSGQITVQLEESTQSSNSDVRQAPLEHVRELGDGRFRDLFTFKNDSHATTQ